MTVFNSPLSQSILIHFIPLVFILGLMIIPNTPPKTKKIKFQVIERPKTESKKVEVGISSASAKKKTKPKKKIKKKINKVFGASRKSLTSQKSTAPIVKAGNTIVKNVDNKKLKKDDLDELPIPKAEYLITDMPSVINQATIQYPDRAKKMGMEGTITLSILIDESGVVRDAQIVEGLIEEMNIEALRAIKLYRFAPAKIEDKPVAVRIN